MGGIERNGEFYLRPPSERRGRHGFLCPGRMLTFDHAMPWWRMVAILAAGTPSGFSWNAFSGRGFALGQSVFIQAGRRGHRGGRGQGPPRPGRPLPRRPPRGLPQDEPHPGRPIRCPSPTSTRAFAVLEPRLRSTFNLVVYCAGYGCEASHIVARKLREKGIHAAILNEGWPAWTDAGYPTKTGSRA